MTPLEYVNSMRLELATGYLESGSSVAQSATLVGYSSPVAFRRAFVSKLGITPSQYQRRFQTTAP